MGLRDEIGSLVGDWPHRDAAPALRVADIISAQGGDYWRARGRQRAERELLEDGLALERVDAVILAIDGWIGPDLDSILNDLRERQST